MSNEYHNSIIMLRIFYWIIELIEKSWERKNKKAADYIEETARKDAHKAVRKRARLKRWRKFLLFLHAIFVLLLSIATGTFAYFFFVSDDSGFWGYLLGFTFAITSINAFSNFLSNFAALVSGVGNISTIEVSDVLDKGYIYALYLRAFVADKKRGNFKEEELVKMLWASNIVTFTVGLPEEVDASPGAARIYISHDTWQQDVKNLMEQAYILLIRICDTEPCLWELEKALSLPNELYLIVDDTNDYTAVSAKCPNIPQKVTIPKGSYIIYKRKGDGNWEYINPHPENKQLKASKRNNTSLITSKPAQKFYVTSLLERFPMPEDNADMFEYEKCINGILSNMITDFYPESNIPVAERLLDLMEAYYSDYANNEYISKNLQAYMKQFAKLKYLPEDIQHRKDELNKKVGICSTDPCQ